VVDVAVARENGLSIRPRGGPQSSDLISMDEAGHLQSRLKSDMASNMSLGIKGKEMFKCCFNDTYVQIINR
jgi:hypothetical protein